ncbi:MAG TPA: ribonuclease HII [Candidatus Udaeobacter sp.]|nr:ribonuclease HII [Candidatus Udaeobacter sp.]
MPERTPKTRGVSRLWLRLRRFDDRRSAEVLCGVDEVGRGPLAGPVVAAAVILPTKARLPGADDSKRLRRAERERLAQAITACARAHAVAGVDSLGIDRLNIRMATFHAMRSAVAALAIVPDLVLVDGFPVPDLLVRHEPVIGGDHLSLSIAAASILAKVHRDRLMDEFHMLYPEYGFDRHRGYGTPEHLEALRRHGPCPIHRLSFAPTRLAAQITCI